jgi:hypothetical protein
VVIVAVYSVSTASCAPGVKVATVSVQATVPATAVVPGPVSLKVAAVRVAQFIASLKVALTTWLRGTPVAPLTGTLEMTIGVVGTAAVVKLQT